MSKTKRSKESKRKARHHGLMVKHAKKSNDKKRMELFRQLIEEKRKIESQSENIVNADEVGVDIDMDLNVNTDINTDMDIEVGVDTPIVDTITDSTEK